MARYSQVSVSPWEDPRTSTLKFNEPYQPGSPSPKQIYRRLIVPPPAIFTHPGIIQLSDSSEDEEDEDEGEFSKPLACLRQSIDRSLEPRDSRGMLEAPEPPSAPAEPTEFPPVSDEPPGDGGGGKGMDEFRLPPIEPEVPVAGAEVDHGGVAIDAGSDEATSDPPPAEDEATLDEPSAEETSAENPEQPGEEAAPAPEEPAQEPSEEPLAIEETLKEEDAGDTSPELAAETEAGNENPPSEPAPTDNAPPAPEEGAASPEEPASTEEPEMAEKAPAEAPGIPEDAPAAPEKTTAEPTQEPPTPEESTPIPEEPPDRKSVV